MIPALLKKPGAFVVGGAVRDRLLARVYSDIDVIVPENPAALSKKIAAATGGSAFALDEERGIHRITMTDGSTLDIAREQGGSLENDLDRRDFTINALAVPAELWDTPRWKSAIVDRHDGRAHLRARRIVAVSKNIWKDDPLRLLRAFRVAAETGFAIAPETLKQIALHKSKIKKPAPERKRDELLRLFDVPDAHRLLVLMEESGLLDEIFPPAKPLRATAVKHYGRGGVLKHTLDSVRCFEDILRDGSWFRGLNSKIRAYLDERVAGYSRRAHCKWGLLLHDIGKPDTMSYDETGRLRFFEHEFVGEKKIPAMAKRFRWSAAETTRYAGYVRHHMRPGNLASQARVTDKAIHRFFRDLGDEAIAMLLISLGDHLTYLTPAQKKRRNSAHEKVTIKMVRRYYTARETVLPAKIIDGNDVMNTLKIKPSPLIGALLKDVLEAQTEGVVKNKSDALAYLKKRFAWHQQQNKPTPKNS
jgi:tRNA nucleotidyltransferase/poly(A) polymerase